MKLTEKQQVFTENIGKLIAFAYEKEIKLTFGHAWRDLETHKQKFREFIKEVKDDYLLRTEAKKTR